MYRLIANSMPMGGPFLLMKLLESFGYANYAQHQTGHTPSAFNYKTVQEALRADGRPQTVDESSTPSTSYLLPPTPAIAVSPFAPWDVPPAMFQQWLEAVPTGHYISGHLPYSAALDPMLQALNYRHILIWRDPQAILAELVFGGEIMPRFLKADLEPLSLAERVEFFLTGGYAPNLGVHITTFVEICRAMLAWEQDSTCFIVHVEDLINMDKQEAVIANLANFLEITVDMVTCLGKINAFPRPVSYLEQLHEVIAADRLAEIRNHVKISH